ncbi:MAG TPA: PIN domain-containing protein [Phycisphaerales bacterium]|nr:PIN domain-containing protein [Phycisphaerales bacterium]
MAETDVADSLPAAEAEVIAGARNRRDLRDLSEVLDRFDRVRVVPGDFDHCVAFAKRHTLSHGVGWPDCLIAATALRLALPVVTLNDRHFRLFRGLRVVRPY